jgi:DNA-binding CsgD family transcriptional regulator
VIAELRALHELGTVEMLDRGDVSFLEEARELAERCFALSTMTVLDLQLAAGYHLIADLDKSLSAAERSSDIARRLRLHVVEAMQLLLAAHVHAARLDAHAAEDALERARAAAPAVLTIEGLAWSFVRSILALLKGDVEFARSALDKGMGYLRLDPTSPPAHCRGLWALVRAVDDDAGEAAIEEVAASGACINFANRAHLSLARAVVLGRSGEGATASKLAEKARAALAPLWRHLVAQLIAPPALDGDWGAPLEWLREADEFFATSGYGEAASAVRALLRRAGARVPRGGRSAAGVPPTLAPLGVTAREAEVLRLVAEGLPNRAIAARLFISPRTVEKHIERLVEKTDVSSRTELVAYANRLR